MIRDEMELTAIHRAPTSQGFRIRSALVENAANFFPEIQGSRIIVAMSGGVDSSVAALMLRERGYDAVGISMQVWDYRNNGGCKTRATCCAPDDFTDARRVAASVGIPYYVFDFERVFRDKVIDEFVRSYREGRTPNPCVDCNNKVKFKELRTRAKTFGGTHVATGHYAKIQKSVEGYHLLRGDDPKKDQSYFLYGLSQEELSDTVFPVGDMTKEEVRELARKFSLPTADKSESQDICFVSGKVQDFLVKLGGKTPQGHIVNQEGEILGEHDGIHRFTVGQRRGIGVGGSENPLYVLELDSSQNRVIVGSKEELKRECFQVESVSWCAPSIKKLIHEKKNTELICRAQLRYRHQGVEVKVKVDPTLPDLVQASFLHEWSAVSPGQACVFYDLDNREVLGGGRLSRREDELTVSQRL